MIIGSQASLNEAELSDRKKRGVKFIELKLDINDVRDIPQALAKKNFIKHLGLAIYAVRPPLTNSYGEKCILGEGNGLKRKDNLNLMKKSILILDKLSDIANPTIILPIGGLLENDEKSPNTLLNKKEMFQKDLMELRKYSAENCPNVILLIENNPMFEEKDGQELNYGYGYEDDIIHWVRAYRDSQIGVCLNIANAIGAVNFNKQYQPNSYFTSVRDYIDVYAGQLQLIHLSNGEGFVRNAGECGLPFYPDNNEHVRVMREIFKTIQDVHYNHPITINTIEENDSEALHFSKTRECILQSLKK